MNRILVAFAALLLTALPAQGKKSYEIRKFLTSVCETDDGRMEGTFEYYLNDVAFTEVESFDDEPPVEDVLRDKPSKNVAIARYRANVHVGSKVRLGLAQTAINGNGWIIVGNWLHKDPQFEYITYSGQEVGTNLKRNRSGSRGDGSFGAGGSLGSGDSSGSRAPSAEESLNRAKEKAKIPEWDNPDRNVFCNWQFIEDDSINSGGVLYAFLYSEMVGKGQVDALLIVRLSFIDEDDDGEDGIYEEDNDASEESGFADYAIPFGVITAVLGIAGAAALRKKKKKKGDNGPDDEAAIAAGTRYQMRVYKDFGDTITIGQDKKYPVYACIVRIPPIGEETIDAPLTAMIQITGDDYLQVSAPRMADGWRMAEVTAPEGDNLPEKGTVTFSVAAHGGRYTNHLHFKIEAGKIRFKQDNLTLPARYEKTVRLPFIIEGMNDGKAAIKSVVIDEKGKETRDYSIDTEWDEEEKCYYAIIKDLLLDEKADKGIAGNYITYSISLEARKGEKAPIKGYLPLLRYYMGLRVEMSANVNCFLEEYNPMKHDSVDRKRMPDGKDYCPAQQECYVKLFDYDEEHNTVLVIDPEVKAVKWTVKDIVDEGGQQKVVSDLMGNEATQMGLDVALAGAGLGSMGSLVSGAHRETFSKYNLPRQRMLEYQQMIATLGLKFQPRWRSTGEGEIYYVLSCMDGVLNAPNRFDAEMELTAGHKGRTYTFKRTVHLLSQPQRHFNSMEEEMEALKQDDRIREGLDSIEMRVFAAGLNKRLTPLLYFIRLQQDFYDADYGYDKRNIEAIKRVYLNTLQREAQENGELAKEATACDNLEWYQLDWWLQRSLEGHEFLEKMPLALRIGFAVASMGFTEIVYEVPYQMKKYVDEGGESVLEGFVVGANVAVKAYLIEAAVTLGLGAVGIGLKGAWRGLGATGGKVSKEAMVKGLKVFGETLKREGATGLKSWLKKQVGWEVGAAEKAIANQTKALLDSIKTMARGSKYTAAEKLAMKQALLNIENLQAALDMCKYNRTVENLRLRDQLILTCQSDKQTMMLLKNPKLIANEPLIKGIDFTIMRGRMNKILWEIYDATDERVIKTLAKEAGVAPRQIKILAASSSKQGKLLSGLDITFDRDVTYYFIKDGKEVYFNQAYTEGLYAKYFREIINGRTLEPAKEVFDPSKLSKETLEHIEALEAKLAAARARMQDQTVIEDVLEHMESYGVDLKRMIDEDFYKEALENPQKVAEAVLHKSTSRFDYADKLWGMQQADGIISNELLRARAVSETMEGCRQMRKVFDLIAARDNVRHITPKLSKELKAAIDLLRPLDGVTAKLSEVETALAQKGYTFRSLAKAVSDAVIQVG